MSQGKNMQQVASKNVEGASSENIARCQFKECCKILVKIMLQGDIFKEC